MKSKDTKRTEALARRTLDAATQRTAVEFWEQAKREDLTLSGRYADTDPVSSKIHANQAEMDEAYVKLYTRKLQSAERDIHNLRVKLGIEEKGA